MFERREAQNWAEAHWFAQACRCAGASRAAADESWRPKTETLADLSSADHDRAISLLGGAALAEAKAGACLGLDGAHASVAAIFHGSVLSHSLAPGSTAGSKAAGTNNKIAELFFKIDEDGSGKLDKAEIKKLLKMMGDRMSVRS